MRTFGLMVVAAIGGYAIGVVMGYFLVIILSSNRHDGSVEAAMTGALVFGPLSAIAGMVVTWFRVK